MAIQVVSPRIGFCREAVLQRWTADDGEWVTAGHPLCLLKTEHSLIPILALEDGFFHVRRPLVPPGTRLKWATPLGILLAPGSDLSTSPPPMPRLPRRVPCRVVPPIRSHLERSTRTDRGPRISPRARRLARELDRDLASVTGTGRDGRIRVRDLESAGLTRRMSRTHLARPTPRRPKSRLAEAPALRVPPEATPLPFHFTGTWELRRSESPRNVEKSKEGVSKSAESAESAEATSPTTDSKGNVGSAGMERLLVATFRALQRTSLRRDISIPQIRLDGPITVHFVSSQGHEGVLREWWLSLSNPQAEDVLVEIQKQLTAGPIKGPRQEPGPAILSVVDLGGWPVESFLPPIPPQMLGALGVGAPKIQVVPVSGKLHAKWTRQLTLVMHSEQVPFLTGLQFYRDLMDSVVGE